MYVGRPSKWGNPFSHLENSRAEFRVATREEAIEKFRVWINAPEQAQLKEAAQQELRGKILACWCAPKACHADVLAEIANGEEP